MCLMTQNYKVKHVQQALRFLLASHGKNAEPDAPQRACIWVADMAAAGGSRTTGDG